MVNHQVDGLLCAVQAGLKIEEIMEYEFAFNDEKGSQIDAQWWSLDNTFPMKARPLIDGTSPSVPGYVSKERVRVFRQWADSGINIARVYLEQTKKRGLECFYSYRVNEDPFDEHKALAQAHPDWLINNEWSRKVWNFAVPGARDFKVSILQELAEDYDFDGLEIDFSRAPLLTKAGHQWEQREPITEFVRRVRAVTLQVEQKRRRTFLLAVRVPDTPIGCHFDGLDVENWVRANLVDILVLGVRSYELNIESFRHVIGDKPIKLLATLDDHHCTDGYSWPPIEVWRGVVANWWQQGVDAIQTFNWGVAPPEVAARLHLKVHGAYFDGSRQIPLYQRAYHELGCPGTLRHKDKTFVVQRRGSGGSGGAPVDNWSTPRFTYQNTNMLAQLPAPLDNLGKVDTLLAVCVADDVAAEAERIEQITLRVLPSDPATEGIPRDKTIDPTMITSFWERDGLLTHPPAKGIEDRIEVRLNGALLERPSLEAGWPVGGKGWLVFKVQPRQLALGKNLVGLRLSENRPEGAKEMTIEKLEVHVSYRQV